jgi:hypothetical protein
MGCEEVKPCCLSGNNCRGSVRIGEERSHGAEQDKSARAVSNSRFEFLRLH